MHFSHRNFQVPFDRRLMDTSMLTKSQVSTNNIYIAATKHLFINVIAKFDKSNLTAGLSVTTFSDLKFASHSGRVPTYHFRTLPNKSDKMF